MWSILTRPAVQVILIKSLISVARELAEAYLQYLYSEEGQKMAVSISSGQAMQKLRRNLQVNFQIELFKIDEAFGGWKNAHKLFADGTTFQSIYLK